MFARDFQHLACGIAESGEGVQAYEFYPKEEKEA